MRSLAVTDDSIFVVKNLHVDQYNFTNLSHNIIEVPQKVNLQENEAISDITVSSDGQHLAVITSVSKQLLVYEIPLSEKYKSYVLPRSASKVRFTADNQHLLVADKTGDVLLYSIKAEDSGTKLLGHLSLLLDVLQTPDKKFIISCDRDEKIKVSCYPNTYNIQTYCLGHKEFVNHIELLPHNEKYLTSSSGDGTIRVWNYTDGKLCYTIDTFLDVNNDQLKEEFRKIMDCEAVEVNSLPIVHFTVSKNNETSSFLAVIIHSFDELLLYKLETDNNLFSHRLIRFKLDKNPSAIQFHKNMLYLYNVNENEVKCYKIVHDTLELSKSIKFFENVSVSEPKGLDDSIKVLYKRRFDNVQEYQERKKQRLEKAKQ